MPRRASLRYAVDPSGCWPWQGALNADGYGTVNSITWGTKAAHRAAYLRYVGPIPEGMELDHLCRNRACVNPSHLEPVTRAENAQRASGWTYGPSGEPLACTRGHDLTQSGSVYVPPGTSKRQCVECRKSATRKRDAVRPRPVGVKPRVPITHCPQGHAYDEANTYVYDDRKGHTRRICRACNRARKAAK